MNIIYSSGWMDGTRGPLRQAYLRVMEKMDAFCERFGKMGPYRPVLDLTTEGESCWKEVGGAQTIIVPAATTHYEVRRNGEAHTGGRFAGVLLGATDGDERGCWMGMFSRRGRCC